MPNAKELTANLPALAVGEAATRLRVVSLLAVLLALGTAALYAPSVRNGFINYDDPDYVTRNAHVLTGLSWTNIIWAFGTDNPAANWHPLTWISHMLDVQWYGTDPAGHHFTNVLLHSLNVAILFLLLQRATQHTLRSAATAAIFALHPLNVESVAWVAERKAVLCVFFMLLAMWAYGWYALKPNLRRYSWVFLFFALALMSKIMVIAMPFGLLLLDYWPLRRLGDAGPSSESPPFLRTLGRLVVEKIPLLLLAAAGGALTFHIHRAQGAMAEAMPLSWRLKNTIYSYLVYIHKAIWPSRLAVFYPHPENSLPWSKVIVAAVVLAGISAMVWRLRKERYLLAGWLWYLGTMAPMIGIVQSGMQGMADRYMYIPMLGLLVAAVWLLGDLGARTRWKEGLLTAAFVFIAAPFAYMTHIQIGYWKDSYTLFLHALKVTENNGIAELNFGAALMKLGQPQLAAPHFEAAVRFMPGHSWGHFDLGVCLQNQNRLEEAAREYRLAIAAASNPFEAAQAHNNLGILYLALRNYPAAITELNSAIALNPNEQNSYIGRGTIELEFWNYDAAIADFTHAAQAAPSPTANYWLGRALESKGDYARAASAYVAALQLDPGMADARFHLKAVQAKPGGRR